MTINLPEGTIITLSDFSTDKSEKIPSFNKLDFTNYKKTVETVRKACVVLPTQTIKGREGNSRKYQILKYSVELGLTIFNGYVSQLLRKIDLLDILDVSNEILADLQNKQNKAANVNPSFVILLQGVKKYYKEAFSEKEIFF